MVYKIPIPTIKRFPSYVRLIKQYKQEGLLNISATLLANDLRLNPIHEKRFSVFWALKENLKLDLMLMNY